MKTVGIIGGIAPVSTIEYYQSLNARFNKRDAGNNYPLIIINSINNTRMLDLLGSGKFKELITYLSSEIEKLAVAGADFGLLASNTPHIVFDSLQENSPIPLISIVEVTAEKAHKQGLKRVGLFGTKFTMQGGFYNKVFAKHNIELICPEEEEQNYIHEKYLGELIKAVFQDKTRIGLVKIIEQMQVRHDLEGLVLGGTELPLILKQTDVEDIQLLDTMEIHLEAILERLQGAAIL